MLPWKSRSRKISVTSVVWPTSFVMWVSQWTAISAAIWNMGPFLNVTSWVFSSGLCWNRFARRASFSSSLLHLIQSQKPTAKWILTLSKSTRRWRDARALQKGLVAKLTHSGTWLTPPWCSQQLRLITSCSSVTWWLLSRKIWMRTKCLNSTFKQWTLMFGSFSAIWLATQNPMPSQLTLRAKTASQSRGWAKTSWSTSSMLKTKLTMSGNSHCPYDLILIYLNN